MSVLRWNSSSTVNFRSRRPSNGCRRAKSRRPICRSANTAARRRKIHSKGKISSAARMIQFRRATILLARAARSCGTCRCHERQTRSKTNANPLLRFHRSGARASSMGIGALRFHPLELNKSAKPPTVSMMIYSRPWPFGGRTSALLPWHWARLTHWLDLSCIPKTFSSSKFYAVDTSYGGDCRLW